MVSYLNAINGIVRRGYQSPDDTFLFQGADIFQAVERKFFQCLAFTRDVGAKTAIGRFWLTYFLYILRERIPSVFICIHKGFVRFDFRQWFDTAAFTGVDFVYIANQIAVLFTTAGGQQQGGGEQQHQIQLELI